MADPNPKLAPLLGERRIASVATVSKDGIPHLTSVWFVYEQGALYLAIPSSSVKGMNLLRNPGIAVMVDTRVAYREAGLTAVGHAEILRGEEAAAIVRRVHEKYLTPEALEDARVGTVFADMDDIAVKLVPRKWLAWDMAELDKQAFDGAMARNRYLKDLLP